MIYYPDKRYNPYIDIKPYEDVVRAMDDVPIDPEAFKFAVVMLYGSVNKLFNAYALAWHTNTKIKLCRLAVRNLKKNKIWIQKGRKVRQEYLRSKKHMFRCLSFWMSVCVANGSMIKSGSYYGLSEWAGNKTYTQKLKDRIRIKQLQKLSNKRIE